MNSSRVTLQFCFEPLARRLAGKGTDKRAQAAFAARVDLVVRVFASLRSTFSPPLTSMPSSFGHDTRAHVARRCRFTTRSAGMGSTECGSERIDN